MAAGTIWRTREFAVRHDGDAIMTRDSRRRFLPTEHCHAALRRATGATRVYQSDSSSKSPAASAASPSPKAENKKVMGGEHVT